MTKFNSSWACIYYLLQALHTMCWRVLGFAQDVHRCLGYTAVPVLGRDAPALHELREYIASNGGRSLMGFYWDALGQRIDIMTFLHALWAVKLLDKDEDSEREDVIGFAEIVSECCLNCRVVADYPRIRLATACVDDAFARVDRMLRNALRPGATHEETGWTVIFAMQLFDRVRMLMTIVYPFVKVVLLEEVADHQVDDGQVVYQFQTFADSVDADLARRLEDMVLSELTSIVEFAQQGLSGARSVAEAGLGDRRAVKTE